MQTEIEAKFLNINVEALRIKLQALGAVQQYEETAMHRAVFDYPDSRLEHDGGWVRVRHEGNKITMSYKQLLDRSITGTKEVNLIIDSFERGVSFLTGIGLEQKAYQETKRELWLLGANEITLDTWPWIPTFVELESPSENELQRTAEQLGFDWQKAMHGSVETAYQYYYNVTEAEIDAWPRIVFGGGSVPEWLEVKRKSTI